MGKWYKGSHGHEHNWKLTILNADKEFSQNEQGWYGVWVDREWQCIRGGKVKHVADYMFGEGFKGERIVLGPRVFLAMSGSPYHVEDPY